MSIRNSDRETFLRLKSKTIDEQFMTTIQEGLNCSPFESHAVLDVVKEVYFPLLAQEDLTESFPGKITLVGVCADEPAGKPIAKCSKRTISLSLHRGSADDSLQQKGGPQLFRQSRISDLCQEAMSKGVLLTREDLAFRIFFVDPRTITRDLAEIRKNHPLMPLPLRGTVQDIGPVLTHRVEIIRLALNGKTMHEICRAMRHSPAAVANYLSTFIRVAQLSERGIHPLQIAFLLKRGPSLINRYLELLSECRNRQEYKYHLNQLLQLGNRITIPPTDEEKKRSRRRHSNET